MTTDDHTADGTATCVHQRSMADLCARQVVEVLSSADERDGVLISYINTMPMGARVLIFCSTDYH